MNDKQDWAPGPVVTIGATCQECSAAYTDDLCNDLCAFNFAHDIFKPPFTIPGPGCPGAGGYKLVKVMNDGD